MVGGSHGKHLEPFGGYPGVRVRGTGACCAQQSRAKRRVRQASVGLDCVPDALQRVQPVGALVLLPPQSMRQRMRLIFAPGTMPAHGQVHAEAPCSGELVFPSVGGGGASGGERGERVRACAVASRVPTTPARPSRPPRYLCGCPVPPSPPSLRALRHRPVAPSSSCCRHALSFFFFFSSFLPPTTPIDRTVFSIPHLLE